MLGFQILDYCTDLTPLIKVIKAVLAVIQFVIPVLLIVLGTIDLGKAVISSDDKEVKAAQSRLIKRVIYAVAIFFVVLLVRLVMGIVGNSGVETVGTDEEVGSESWIDCWDEAK